MNRAALERDLKAARKVLREVEGDRDAIVKIIEELRAKKDPAAVATLPKHKAVEQRLEDDLVNFNIGTNLERLRDAEITVQTAKDEIARLEAQLERLDRLALADKLELVLAELHHTAQAVDGRMVELVRAFRDHREAMMALVRLDRGLGRLAMVPHQYRMPARSAWQGHEGRDFLPTDYVNMGGARFASIRYPAIEAKIAELRSDPQDVAA